MYTIVDLLFDVIIMYNHYTW